MSLAPAWTALAYRAGHAMLGTAVRCSFRRVLRLKTGAARLALAQEARPGQEGRLTLLPVGLHFVALLKLTRRRLVARIRAERKELMRLLDPTRRNYLAAAAALRARG